MKLLILLMFRSISLASLIFASAGIVKAQTTPVVQVHAYAQHLGGKFVYHYQVTNNSRDNIAAIWIGYDTKNDDDGN
jgi:hypothetical protein